jgi:ubiquitin-protein ligase
MLRPRLRQGTGYVLNGGGICMELLTPSEWSPATSISALVMSVRAMLLMGNVRLKETARSTTEHDYSLEEVRMWAEIASTAPRPV